MRQSHDACSCRDTHVGFDTNLMDFRERMNARNFLRGLPNYDPRWDDIERPVRADEANEPLVIR